MHRQLHRYISKTNSKKFNPGEYANVSSYSV